MYYEKFILSKSKSSSVFGTTTQKVSMTSCAFFKSMQTQAKFLQLGKI